jgi:thiamine phosphate synthase YjbQ (UPF0047 family)
MCSFGIGKVGHFLDVPLPDHTAKTGVVGIFNQHHTTSLILPEQNSTRLVAQFAAHLQ